MKTALFAVVGLLALSFVPVSGHAQMPGEKCGGADKVQVGTTKIATDSQNIIACLLTGNTAPGANVSEWKSMTSSNNGGSSGGNGGITGGCSIRGSWTTDKNLVTTKTITVDKKWGVGCQSGPVTYSYNEVGSCPSFTCDQSCDRVQSPGYSCGVSAPMTGGQAGDGSFSYAQEHCICVKT